MVRLFRVHQRIAFKVIGIGVDSVAFISLMDQPNLWVANY